MDTYRAILVPLDGSALGEHALPLAIGVARRAGARLCLARVYGRAHAPDLEADAAELAERQHALCALEALARQARAASGQAIEVALLDDEAGDGEAGAPASRIAGKLHSYAAATGIDLVVMTTHGRGGLSRLWLGSVVDSLLHQASLPILLTRPEVCATSRAPGEPFSEILIPLDGSPLAEHAIAPALALGSPEHTSYTVLQIVSPLLAEHTVPPYSAGLPAAEYAQLEGAARAYLSALAARLRDHAARVRIELAVAEPAEAILRFAAEHRVDLIAMATHGYSVLARTVLGSVADRVARAADVPVLVYRPEGAARWRHPPELADSV
jgi:nucleotide-binding universal stress UspA family protein